MINEEVRHILEAELNPNEKLLWADKPAKRPYPWRGVYRAAFWCCWMLFVCYWLFGVITAAEFASTLLKIVFIFVGVLFLIFGFAIRKTYLKGFLGPKYEIYGLTNQRAIILSPLWKGQKFINWRGHDHSRNSIAGDELNTIKVDISADSSIGTIIFSGWWDKIRYSWYVFPNPETPKILSNLNGFRNVNNPLLVTDLFERTFGSVVTFSNFDAHNQADYLKHSQNQNEELKVQKIREVKKKRLMLFSIFPAIWMLFTLLVGPSGWLFLSFITFPFFIASAFHAIREFIRPEHSYRINP